MRGSDNLQTGIEKLILVGTSPAAALRDIITLVCRKTRSRVALLSRGEDSDKCAPVIAHHGVSTRLADRFCAALAPYRTECTRTCKSIAVHAIDKAVLAAFPEELHELKIGRLLVIPLYKLHKPLGCLILARRTADFDTDTISTIEQNRAGLVLLLEQLDYLDTISLYSNFANYDGLTGLYNHRYFQQALDKEISRSQRLNHPVSLMMIDIDHFKQYNDSFGHPQGDAALKNIAGALQRSIRSYDLAARYGGEEMVVILPQVPPNKALSLAERIRTAVAELPFRGATDTHRVKLTVSIGIAGIPAHAKIKSELIERADQALYLAKEEGRNRVSISLVRSRKSIRFAYCPPAFTSPYYSDILTGVRDVMNQIGGISLVARAPDRESDYLGLARICRSIINDGIDAIALSSHSDAVAPVVRELNKANVPVFFFNALSKIEGADVVSYVGYRQRQAGREVGRFLARSLREHGSILILKGLPNSSSADRVAGFRNEIARFPNIRVVATRKGDWERAKSRRAVEQVLAKQPIDAIYAVSDEMALGACEAVAAAGYSGKIFIVGQDGTNAALQAIRDGVMTATLNTNPREMGRILMRTVVRGLNRRDRVEPKIFSPINIVNLENVDHF
ncbi:MAG: diguanylate cyclase [Deltaproteobacteria bacterium]|nr:diguanylate cyclase [Deltaproteobacteria bacterium]